MPAAWDLVEVGTLVDLEKGLSYKGSGLGSGLPMLNLGCFLGHGRFEINNAKFYSGEYRPRHLVESGELVLANTDMTQNRVTLGSPGIVPEWSGHKRYLFSHHVYAARRKPEAAKGWVEFLYYLLQEKEARERAAGFATGTTVLALPREAVLRLRFPRPPAALMELFVANVRALREKQLANVVEVSTLRTLRDLVLPRLLSGELSVRDADRVLEAAP